MRRIANWLDDAWAYRFALSVPHALSTGANDVSAVIPKAHPIWAVLTAEATEGDSIRVTDGDGVTQLTFQLTDAALSGSWSTSGKNGGIKIDDALFITGTSVKLLWVYYGNSAATSASGSVTLASAQAATTFQRLPPRGQFVDALPQPPGATVATPDVSKSAAENRWIWVRVNGMLAGRGAPVESSQGAESIWGLVCSSVTNGSGASVHDATKTRFVEDPEGSFYAAQWITGGTDNTDYVVIGAMTTGVDMSATANTDQTLETRFRLLVRDAEEA